MARNTSSKPTRIWNFGAKRPITNVDTFWDHLFLAHRYYNKLVEIERERQEDFRVIRRRYAPELAVYEEKMEEISAQIGHLYRKVKKLRQQTWAK